MNEGIYEGKTLNMLSGELPELKEGIPHIMMCMASSEHFGDKFKNPHYYFNQSDVIRKYFVEEVGEERGVTFVNYDAKKQELPKLKELGFRNFPKRRVYHISPVNTTDKFSIDYLTCTGLIVVGKDKETGENISFLTHQDPDFILQEEIVSWFDKDLTEAMEEIMGRCEEGTIEAVLIGGHSCNDRSARNQSFAGGIDIHEHLGIKDEKEGHEKEYTREDQYLASISFVQKAVKGTLGISTTIMGGPKLSTGPACGPHFWDDTYFDTKDRRLYLIRAAMGKNGEEVDNPNIDSSFIARID